MKNLIIAVLMVLAIVSCKTAKLPVEPPNIIMAKLNGQWAWKKTTGGIAGVTITAETARYILHIAFKNNELFFYKNNAITQRYHFSLVKDKTIYSTDSLYIIKPDTAGDDLPLVITKLVNDTVVLADNAHDGFTSVYVKKHD